MDRDRTGQSGKVITALQHRDHPPAGVVGSDLAYLLRGPGKVVLDQPQVSDQATSSNRLQINLLGALLGFVVGFAIVALLEVKDTSFRTEGDILTVRSLPVLATVPFAPSAADLSRDRRQRLLIAASAAAMLLVCVGVFWYLQLWKFVA